jgi:hypothetical protein
MFSRTHSPGGWQPTSKFRGGWVRAKVRCSRLRYHTSDFFCRGTRLKNHVKWVE